MSGPVLWIALAIALSPAVVELIQHWTREPWARESAVFVPLALACAVADRSPRRPNRAGWLLLVAAVALALFGSTSGLAAFGRLAIPLGAIGMALAIGHPPARVALIAIFVIPPPFSIVSVVSPGGERAVALWVADAARSLGADWVAGNATIRTSGGDLRLGAADLGVPLAHLLGGLGFCAGLVSGAGSLASFLRGLVWTVWALPIQITALAIAFALMLLVNADVARSFLDVAPTCAIVAVGVAHLGSIRASSAPIDILTSR